MLTTRELALKALGDIWQRGLKPKHVLEDLSQPLDGRERSFLMELVYGVVRHRDTLDLALKSFLKKPFRLGADTLNNLRLAAYQILFLRVPERAAVHEAVEIEKQTGRPELVNAVLRNLLRVPPEKRLDLEPLRKKGATPYIALRTSHPEWLVKRWIRRFGEEEALALAEANNEIPPLTLRVNTLRATRDEVIEQLLRKGIAAVATGSSPEGIRLEGPHAFREFPELRDSVTVQDEAAQLIAHLLGPEPGERVWDACAAPGGKATHIAQLMEDRGEIIATDTDGKRLRLLKENVERLGVKAVRVVQSDAKEYSDTSLFDRILLDAPCSSTGVIRRNPDVKYRHTSKDLGRFGLKQGLLLRAVARFLRPGGIFVYSVCSTEPEEGEDVIKEFLKDSPDFYIIDTTVPFLKDFLKNGFFRTYPHKNRMDGFFGVKLCRKI
ncbi:MAG: 16S rRNA (cytosine(967)-C(5))-methyltransferase RsmB [Nitrospirae bacterium]|nr:16S rRNA (cytosine(967)-C(5))-methyltransferase RsmB [Nitrospirota bacterium]